MLYDLEGDGNVATAIHGADAVVFAAGAGPGSGAERKWTIDHGAAVKLIAAAKSEGVGRCVMVSSMGAANSPAEGGGVLASTYGPRQKPIGSWKRAVSTT